MAHEDFREVLISVCRRPAIYVGRKDFDLAVAFLDGYDEALRDWVPSMRDRGLSGFREWLAVRLDSCMRSHWPEIIRREDTGPDKFEALERLYEEFWCDRGARGLEAILAEYEQLRVAARRRDRKCWCEEPGPDRDL
jgi:hypothetical protein